MPSYTGYRNTIDKIRTLLVDGAIKPMAFELFEQERGIPIRQTLPDEQDGENFDFNINGLTGEINPDTTELYNPQFNGELLTVNGIASDPERLVGIGSAVYAVWEDVFGENRHGVHQPDHPGDPPFSIEGLESMLESLFEQYELLCADPMLEDLIGAIRDHNYRLAIKFLGAENPELVLDPTIGHELHNLFTNGDITVVYQDSKLALLKPEYNLDGDESLMEQQWNARQASDTVVVGENMRDWIERELGDIDARDDMNVVESDDPWEGRIVQGEWPQEAFVVGRDDTPVGLFAHSVDGTRLSPTQNVSKSYIQDVMGFDKQYRHENDRIELNVGERMRLQGDLAIRYVSGDSVSDAGRCPIPIDNHYVALDSGVLAPGETKDVEPIQVRVPDGTYLNIAHDEHENVAVELAGGEYEFYLLTRGLQPEEERPDWMLDE